ncbi:LpxI family protein [Palleronia sp. KMU-117]|uniref:LpxI family protein n=1 Tax=Palleronia sp. KMU-117 TaxID=3434108 RepID=UPI003D728232
MLALIAGQGALPALVLRRRPDALVCELAGFPSGLAASRTFRIERLGAFLQDLRTAGVTEVCLAGRVGRPRLDPAAIDTATLPLVPRMMAALAQGDDAALRLVLAFFEEAGFAIRAAHDLVPEVLPSEGVLTGAAPGPTVERDLARARAAHAALGAADVGQAVVVAEGQVIAVEALPGTDWMLTSLLARDPVFAPTGGLFDDPLGVAADVFGGVAQGPRPRRDPALPAGGILYKAPKPGQDRRVDLPAIGPETLRRAAAAGLEGIVIEAGGVMLLDRDAALAVADRTGLFLWVRPPDKAA